MIRASKVRYYKDRRFTERVVSPPDIDTEAGSPRPDDWSALPAIAPQPEAPTTEPETEKAPNAKRKTEGDADSTDLRREPDMERHIDIAPPPLSAPANEFDLDEPEPDADAARQISARRQMQVMARQASLDPGDGIEL